ncbi:VOC family protein [Paraburkholderia sp.]|uniref:VOC family protein n=1 Tax=Paraburkholderia sp. TaxID=1926495 RepID=UPI002614D8AE|nr:VOC family protein [Paraburkholderia sp.]
MIISMSRLILYVHDVEALKSFYEAHFALPIVEEIPGEWVVFNAGAIELALHLVGEPYRNMTAKHAHSNAKMVFSVPSGLDALRDKLVAAGVNMRELKRYEGFPYLLCDGEDPEGNVFQLSQAD